MDYIKLLELLFFVNLLFITDLIVYYKLRAKEIDKHSKGYVVDTPITVEEEYEDVMIDEFDDRITELKQEITKKRNDGEFEVNQAEVITEEYEQHLYSSIE